MSKNIGYDIDRDACGLPCDCGGYADRVDCTEAECRDYGCGRDHPGMECCARAFVCRICKTRLVGGAESPEMDLS